MKYTENNFKVGDTIKILKSPRIWSSYLNKNCPMGNNIYPYVCVITGLHSDNNNTHIEAGNYGWSLKSLIIDGLIEKLENNNDYEIY